MAITVEFYGVPRERAGKAEATVTGAGRLGDVLVELGASLPRWAETCLEGDRLRPGYVANVNGERFISDPDIALWPGDRLLIMAADAGG
jgi:molybdopterin converting factor small subunit